MGTDHSINLQLVLYGKVSIFDRQFLSDVNALETIDQILLIEQHDFAVSRLAVIYEIDMVDEGSNLV